MSKYTDRKYVIINQEEVSGIDFSQVMQTSANTLRYKVDGSQTFVKFKGDTPDFLNNKTQYTLLEMQTFLNNVSNGWIDENED